MILLKGLLLSVLACGSQRFIINLLLTQSHRHLRDFTVTPLLKPNTSRCTEHDCCTNWSGTHLVGQWKDTWVQQAARQIPESHKNIFRPQCMTKVMRKITKLGFALKYDRTCFSCSLTFTQFSSFLSPFSFNASTHFVILILLNFQKILNTVKL